MLNFPNSPTVGQMFSAGLVTWTWDGVKWASAGLTSAGGGAGVSEGDTPPPGPSLGALWFDTTGMNMYVWYNDGSSNQWSPVVTGGWPAITYAILPAEVQQIPVSFPFAGKPPATSVVNIVMGMALTVAANLPGTRTFASVGPTGTPVFTVNRIPAGSTAATAIGTVTVTSQTACTVTGTGASFAAGDTLQIATPAQDATLADLSITILANRV